MSERIPVAELKQLAKVLEISTAERELRIKRELSSKANGYSGYRSLFYSFHLCSHIYFIEKM